MRLELEQEVQKKTKDEIYRCRETGHEVSWCEDVGDGVRWRQMIHGGDPEGSSWKEKKIHNSGVAPTLDLRASLVPQFIFKDANKPTTYQQVLLR